MPTLLKQVLMIFEQSPRPLTLAQMAHHLNIDQNMLESMIEYWVRKGKLRESGQANTSCIVCSTKGQCPFVVKAPRSYELASSSEDSPKDPAPPPCSCCM